MLADVPFFFPAENDYYCPQSCHRRRQSHSLFLSVSFSLSRSLFMACPYKCVALFLSPSYNILRLIIMRRCMNHLVRSVIVAMLLYILLRRWQRRCCRWRRRQRRRRRLIRRRRRLQKNIYRVPVLLSLEEGCREMEITNAQRGRAVTKAVWKFHNNILTPILPPEIPCILSYRLHLYIIIVYFVYIYICMNVLSWIAVLASREDRWRRFFSHFFLIWCKKKRVKTELNIILLWRTRSHCAYIIILLYR